MKQNNIKNCLSVFKPIGNFCFIEKKILNKMVKYDIVILKVTKYSVNINGG